MDPTANQSTSDADRKPPWPATAIAGKSTTIPDVDRVFLTEESLDYTGLVEAVRTPSAGAVTLFLGTVRLLTAGRETTALRYEAYTPMAEAQIRQLVVEARQLWSIERVAVAHRLGDLELGEISVATAVSSAHRPEAFAAGRYLIDELKKRVPIWKRELWADGQQEWVHPKEGVPRESFIVEPGVDHASSC